VADADQFEPGGALVFLAEVVEQSGQDQLVEGIVFEPEMDRVVSVGLFERGVLLPQIVCNLLGLGMAVLGDVIGAHPQVGFQVVGVGDRSVRQRIEESQEITAKAGYGQSMPYVGAAADMQYPGLPIGRFGLAFAERVAGDAVALDMDLELRPTPEAMRSGDSDLGIAQPLVGMFVTG
jgi:hypothetical protein